MNTRPALLRSIPFWILVAVSVLSLALGAWIFAGKIGSMSAGITDQSATAVDVYVGPSVALFGAVLVGAGVIGILLALAVATAASLRPHTPVEIVEPIDWTDEEAVSAVEVIEPEEFSAEPAVAAAEPVAADAAPVAADAVPVEADAPATDAAAPTADSTGEAPRR